MAYNDWLRALSKLPKSAEFCLADVTERVSAGDNVLNFVITEAVGDDLMPTGRRGQTEKVCRPRTYIVLGSSEVNAEHRPVEIAEPLAAVEKTMISKYQFSLHEFYILNQRLCESVLTSLTTKVGVISQSSAAVLESQLGKEIVQLITKRLEGAPEEAANLKSLLIDHLAGAMNKAVIKQLREVRNDVHESVLEAVTIKDTVNEMWWSFTMTEERPGLGRYDLAVNWKEIQLSWTGGKASVLGNVKQLCCRDMFLFLVNLPAFGKMIATKLAKIMEA